MDHFKHFLVPQGGVDSHFHAVVMQERDLPVADILSRAFSDGLTYALDIATTLEDFTRRLSVLSDFSGVYLTAGVHPSGAGLVDIEQVHTLLPEQLAHPRVVALGEIGLDWYRNYGTPPAQRKLFEAQIEIANRLRLPVIIHNRQAEADILDILRAHPPESESIMHCFSADANYARKFMDLGFSISFAGNLTFKKSDDLRDVARFIPEDRLLAETDAPFLAPEPARGRPNHPGYVGHTYAVLAQLRDSSVEELSVSVTRNFQRIFKLS